MKGFRMLCLRSFYHSLHCFTSMNWEVACIDFQLHPTSQNVLCIIFYGNAMVKSRLVFPHSGHPAGIPNIQVVCEMSNITCVALAFALRFLNNLSYRMSECEDKIIHLLTDTLHRIGLYSKFSSFSTGLINWNTKIN